MAAAAMVVLVMTASSVHLGADWGSVYYSSTSAKIELSSDYFS